MIPTNFGMAHFMSAATGVDIVTGTGANVPTGNIQWKGFVVLIEATVTAFVDDGDTDSTGIVSTVLPVGAVVTANGKITSITMSAGTIEMIRA